MANDIILAQSNAPKIDYSGIKQFEPTQVFVSEPEPSSAVEQVVGDPTNMILLAILGAVVLGVLVLKQRKG